jgi:hypothetical protein
MYKVIYGFGMTLSTVDALYYRSESFSLIPDSKYGNNHRQKQDCDSRRSGDDQACAPSDAQSTPPLGPYFPSNHVLA